MSALRRKQWTNSFLVYSLIREPIRVILSGFPGMTSMFSSSSAGWTLEGVPVSSGTSSVSRSFPLLLGGSPLRDFIGGSFLSFAHSLYITLSRLEGVALNFSYSAWGRKFDLHMVLRAIPAPNVRGSEIMPRGWNTSQQTHIGSNDAVRLRIFPLSLCDTAKDWLQSLPAGSITTWAALTQKFLTKYFPPAKTAKMLNDITSFVQLDRESLYDAWERFKSMLRKCPHHELPVWRQVQTFYNGVTLANRATIDAAAGGTIMKKLPSEVFNIIDEITTNLYSYGQERTDERAVGIHSIDAVSALSAQMTALTQTVNNLGAAMWNGTPIGPCGACGQMGHWSQDCKVGNQFSIHEDATFVSHDGRSNFNPYSNTYNPGWRSHPKFSWSNNQQQGPVGPLQPRQPPPQKPKSNLEDMFFKFIAATDTRFQSQEAAIQNIKVQIGQLVNIVSGRREGQLPSDTEKNPREQVNAISVNNGQTIENESPKEQVEEAQAHKEEEPQMPSSAKFLKEVLSTKRKWEGGETVKLNEECSTILQNKLPPKLKDPGSCSSP
ncbi:UNVERIFIED_CONTAM: hypothetical protein Slati_1327300 [Sesamum latifolium]|uniref:CCHC-type domain-containing protein n=1 Tax=Sesamum latifolium TaxID=2727402 RepID=A0AAW2XH50_9LAMI